MKIIIALAAALLATGAVAQNTPPATDTATQPTAPPDQGSMNMGSMHGMRSGTHHMRRHHHRMMRHHHRMMRHHHHMHHATTATTKKY